MSSNRTNGTKPAIQHTKSILNDRRIRLLLAILGAIVAWMVVTIVVQPGTTRTINLTGDRYAGDAFQDALLAHKIKYGTGKTVIKPYVYFCMLTGKGEQGLISIVIDEDPSGAAGSNAGIKATLTAKGTPTEYTYSSSESP